MSKVEQVDLPQAEKPAIEQENEASITRKISFGKAVFYRTYSIDRVVNPSIGIIVDTYKSLSGETYLVVTNQGKTTIKHKNEIVAIIEDESLIWDAIETDLRKNIKTEFFIAEDYAGSIEIPKTHKDESLKKIKYKHANQQIDFGFGHVFSYEIIQGYIVRYRFKESNYNDPRIAIKAMVEYLCKHEPEFINIMAYTVV
jgi:hypothetical protein